MELLFRLHADELTGERRDLYERLNAVWAGGTLTRRENAKLGRQLAVAELDAARLKAIWKSTGDVDGLEAFRSDTSFRDIGFIEEFGDVRSQDPEVIDWLIDIVARPGMFTPRSMAMVSLGKIGPAAGARAVEVIRANIHDSSQWVHDIRELIIRRITTQPSEWVACTKCHRGRVLAMEPYVAHPSPCPACKGMSFVSVERSSTT